MDVHLASIRLTDAARLLSRASGKQAVSDSSNPWEVEEAISRIQQACGDLGYDVVKRAPAEAPAPAVSEAA